MKQPDPALEYLLDLDGEAFAVSERYFVSIKAQRVKAKPEIPHGVKYAINLFDKDKNRIIGLDNAHGYKEHRRMEWDHVHKKERVLAYQFESAGKLLEDFWDLVNQFLEATS